MKLYTNYFTLARIAGLCLTLQIVFGIVITMGLVPGLIDYSDPTQTASNLLAAEPVFRISLVVNLWNAIVATLLVVALYHLLVDTGRVTAMLAALLMSIDIAFRVIQISINYTNITMLSHPEPFLTVGDVASLHGLVFLLYELNWSFFHFALVLVNIGLALFACLFFRSGMIPKPVAALAIAAPVFASLCMSYIFIYPQAGNALFPWFTTPNAVAYIVLALWLLVWGVKRQSPETA